jgi:hypothetical protein
VFQSITSLTPQNMHQAMRAAMCMPAATQPHCCGHCSHTSWWPHRPWLRLSSHKCCRESCKKKIAASAIHLDQGVKMYTFTIESYGYVDKDGMDMKRALARAASSTGHVTLGDSLTVYMVTYTLLGVRRRATRLSPGWVCICTPVSVALPTT